MKKKRPSQRVGYCCKCGQIRVLQRHHTLPLRFFRGRNQSVLLLCEKCHKAVERLIPYARKLRRSEYLDLHRLFLRHDSDIPLMIPY